MGQLYRDGSAVNARAQVMLHHLSGAMDAGEAGRMAVNQLLGVLPVQRVATFCSDELLDYRSKRPRVRMSDWVISQPEDPQIALDLVEDFAGTRLLILHGEEPDMRWQQFAHQVAQLARRAGVSKSIGMMGMPAALPHTRSPFVHCTSPKPELIPSQPRQNGALVSTASIDMYLQAHLSNAGIESYGLVAGVPYYLAEGDYPPASVVLLEYLCQLAGLSLPVGDLEAQAEHQRRGLDSLISDSQEMSQMVEGLEQRWDSAWQDPTEPKTPAVPDSAPRTSNFVDARAAAPVEALIGRLQRFLAKSDARREGSNEVGGGFCVVEKHAGSSEAPSLDAVGGSAPASRVPAAPWGSDPAARIDPAQGAPLGEAPAGSSRGSAKAGDLEKKHAGQPRRGAHARGQEHRSNGYPPRASRRRPA